MQLRHRKRRFTPFMGTNFKHMAAQYVLNNINAYNMFHIFDTNGSKMNVDKLLKTDPHILSAILKKMYKNTSGCINGTGAKFDILIACRKGGQESPCIFNFEYVLKLLLIK